MDMTNTNRVVLRSTDSNTELESIPYASPEEARAAFDKRRTAMAANRWTREGIVLQLWSADSARPVATFYP